MPSFHYAPRQSFTHVSTHQTYISKALQEHARDIPTIAAVACMSSSLLKSSLGPNLLALTQIYDISTMDLFEKIFSKYNPHMQLTQVLDVLSCDTALTSSFVRMINNFGPLFSSCLLRLRIVESTFSSRSRITLALPLFSHFTKLKKVELCLGQYHDALTRVYAVLPTLPNLEELSIKVPERTDAFFKCLGDLERCLHLKFLAIDVVKNENWHSAAFQQHFCNRLLRHDRLLELSLDEHFLPVRSMTPEDFDCWNALVLPSMIALAGPVPSRLVQQQFRNLLKIDVCVSSGDVTNDDLIDFQNYSLQLQEMSVDFLDTVSPTSNPFLHLDLHPAALRTLRVLNITSFFRGLKSDDIFGSGFSRLVSLESISICLPEVTGSSLQHLPYPQFLKKLHLVADDPTEHSFKLPGSSSSILFQCTNLRSLALQGIYLSRDEVLRFVGFENLEELALETGNSSTPRNRVDDCCLHKPEPFRTVLPQLTHLRKLECSFTAKSRWSYVDVEFIAENCKSLEHLKVACRTTEFIPKQSSAALLNRHLMEKYSRLTFLNVYFDFDDNETAKLVAQIVGQQRERNKGSQITNASGIRRPRA